MSALFKVFCAPGNAVTDRDVINSHRGLFGRKRGSAANQPMAESGAGGTTAGPPAAENV